MRNVVIVGGGPGGLILASLLKDHGIDYRLFERGKIAQSWRAMRQGMNLLSPAVPGTDWTSLSLDDPIWALPGAKRPFPSREDFLCYVDAFARERRLRVEENTVVYRAARAPGRFSLDTSAGEEECRFLVLATGASTVPNLPDIPGAAGNPSVIHACDFVHCMAYAGKRVLVIGGGNSAAEIAIELAGTAAVTVCTRNPLRYFSETGGLEDIRGTSESVLKELVRFGIIGLREADPVVRIAGTVAVFRSGAESGFDRIICATGYRPFLLPVAGGEIATDPDGFPVIKPTGESTVPGLYFCGSLARFNRRCAFIHGFRNYVEKVFWDIADRL